MDRSGIREEAQIAGRTPDWLEPISLYLHIPFCRYRCSYCDFNTYTTLDELRDSYTQAMCAELEQVSRDRKRAVKTLFFGGGTPSLMSPYQIEKIMSTVFSRFGVESDAEITMEANPETVSVDYFRQVRASGLNRISFGAQSAVESELVLLGREHRFTTVVDAVDMARTAGIDELSIDLIYGVPGQTVASWEQSLRAALDLGIDHLSIYCLTVEPGTPMDRWVTQGEIPPPDPDLAADQYDLATDLFARYGFEQYEISNWSKPGHQSRHNLAYWTNDTYLGLGAGAHGHADGKRYKIVRQPRTYIRRLMEDEGRTAEYPLSTAVASSRTLSREDQMSETIFMGLRLLVDGLDVNRFEARFGEPITAEFGDAIDKHLTGGLLEWIETPSGRALRLTDRGRFLSNSVFSDFI